MRYGVRSISITSRERFRAGIVKEGGSWKCKHCLREMLWFQRGNGNTSGAGAGLERTSDVRVQGF